MTTQTTPASAAAHPFSGFEPGTALMLQTDDRKHPFRAVILEHWSHGVTLETKKSSVEIILRGDGSVSHLVRWPVCRMASPTTPRLVGWQLVT